jgi:hypothetical protein
MTDAPEGVAHNTRQREFIDGLRKLADFLEAHPEVPAEYGVNFIVNAGWADDGLTAPERLARIARIPGGWEKQSDEHSFDLVRKFGAHTLTVFANHEYVCERVVHTETVTREVPDPERLAEVPTITVTEEVERVEWKCPESLLGFVRAES